MGDDEIRALAPEAGPGDAFVRLKIGDSHSTVDVRPVTTLAMTEKYTATELDGGREAWIRMTHAATAAMKKSTQQLRDGHNCSDSDVNCGPIWLPESGLLFVNVPTDEADEWLARVGDALKASAEQVGIDDADDDPDAPRLRTAPHPYEPDDGNHGAPCSVCQMMPQHKNHQEAA